MTTKKRKFKLNSQRIADVLCHYLRDKHFPDHHIELELRYLGSGVLKGAELLVTKVESKAKPARKKPRKR